MTGTFEPRIAWVISRIDEPSPPGVSIVSSTAGDAVGVRVLDGAAQVVGHERIDDPGQLQLHDGIGGLALRLRRPGRDQPEPQAGGQDHQAGDP